eukprot:SAG22_NODE_451_length_10354_cov_5.184983_6_plen_124_part_00
MQGIQVLLEYGRTGAEHAPAVAAALALKPAGRSSARAAALPARLDLARARSGGGGSGRPRRGCRPPPGRRSATGWAGRGAGLEQLELRSFGSEVRPRGGHPLQHMRRKHHSAAAGCSPAVPSR